MLREFLQKHLPKIAFIGLVSGIGLAVGYTFSPEVKTSLTPVPETFTELYFEDHLDLPKIVTPDEKYDFAFTIHNLEYRTLEYETEVLALPENASDEALPLSSKKILLNHDEYKTLPIQFTLPLLEKQRVKVVVNLKNLDQSLHFWVILDGSVATPEADISATASATPVLLSP